MKNTRTWHRPLRSPQCRPRNRPPTYHLKDDAEVRTKNTCKTRRTRSYRRNRVESVLRKMIEKSELMRSMDGPTPRARYCDLVQQVLIEEPSINLQDLLVHFPNKSASIELAIRQVIGLAPEKIEQSLETFRAKHPGLNSNQLRFLDLIKNYLSKYGSIDPEKLWEDPFTSVSSDGIDGVFPQDDQIEDLLGLVRELATPLN